MDKAALFHELGTLRAFASPWPAEDKQDRGPLLELGAHYDTLLWCGFRLASDGSRSRGGNGTSEHDRGAAARSLAGSG